MASALRVLHYQLVEDAAAEARKAIDSPELPRRILRYSEVDRRLVPYTFLEKQAVFAHLRLTSN